MRQISNSLTQTHAFSVRASDPSAKISGTIEVRGSNWIFPKPAVRLPLQRENRVDKNMWDTFYSIHVTPDQDVDITLSGPAVRNLWVYAIIVMIILAIAGSLILAH